VRWVADPFRQGLQKIFDGTVLMGDGRRRRLTANGFFALVCGLRRTKSEQMFGDHYGYYVLVNPLSEQQRALPLPLCILRASTFPSNT
jgi:hypothetical protein